jgi:hypothetical protein
MTPILTREELRKAIEQFLAGELGASALATWAFDQFYAAEEAGLVYEPGSEQIIGEILDELMWADSTPFVLEVEAARRLHERLNRSVSHGRDEQSA